MSVAEGTLEARTEWLDAVASDGPASFEAEAVGRYVVVRELASGGMATVHLARYESAFGLQRIVALKRIHPHLAGERRFVEMFFDEARLAARIDHPFVCRVLDFGRADGSFFLAMEYLAGEPLSVVRRALRKRPEALGHERHPYRVARMLADLAEGLHAAHELRSGSDSEGLVHRDVSPGNLYLLYDGTVRVADFGIARAAHRLHRTETGTVKGTFAYASPEQLRGERLDRRSDVWSLGVVLWELLTGERLFRRAEPGETVRLVSTMPIAPPSSVRPGIPAVMDDVVMTALRRRSERRFPSARAMAEALEQVIEQDGVAVSRAELGGWLRELVPGGAERVEQLVLEASDDSEVAPTRLALVDRGASTVRGPTSPPGEAPTEVREGRGTVAPPASFSSPWLLALLGAVLLGGAAAWWSWSRYAPASTSPSSTNAGDQVPAAPGSMSSRSGVAEPDDDPMPAQPGLIRPTRNPMLPDPTAAAANPSTGETDSEPLPADLGEGEGAVHVTTEGGWALVRWRGRDLGRTPLQTRLPAGVHRLELLPEGRPPARTVRVVVRAGRQVVVGVRIGASP